MIILMILSMVGFNGEYLMNDKNNIYDGRGNQIIAQEKAEYSENELKQKISVGGIFYAIGRFHLRGTTSKVSCYSNRDSRNKDTPSIYKIILTVGGDVMVLGWHKYTPFLGISSKLWLYDLIGIKISEHLYGFLEVGDAQLIGRPFPYFQKIYLGVGIRAMMVLVYARIGSFISVGLDSFHFLKIPLYVEATYSFDRVVGIKIGCEIPIFTRR